MKSVITLACILAVLLAIGWCCQYDLMRGCKIMSEGIQEALDTEKDMTDLMDQWKQYRDRWHLYLDHRDLREIDLLFELTEEAWLQQDTLEYRRSAIKLEAIFIDLPLREELSWLNVI